MPAWRPWLLAVSCMPALAIIVTYGLAVGPLAASLLALGGAFTVGFGAFKKLTDYSLAPMIVVAIGMGASAWMGSMLGNHFWLLCLFAALFAAVCALMSAIDDALWWITSQWSIALLVAGAFPGDVGTANHRALCILIGAGIQIVCFYGVQRLLSPAQETLSHRRFLAELSDLRADLVSHLRVRRYGLYSASVVALSLWVAHALQLSHGYWAPMTALLVLKAHPREALTRGTARLLGTLGGCVLASLIGVSGVTGAAMAAVGLCCALLAYGVQGGRYSLFTLCLTATVVTTTALGGVPEWQAAWDRLEATALGGALAIIVLSLETWIARFVPEAA